MSRCLFRQTQCVYPCGVGINDGGKGNFLAIIRFEYSELPVICLHIHCLTRNRVKRIFLYIKKLYVSKNMESLVAPFRVFVAAVMQ